MNVFKQPDTYMDAWAMAIADIFGAHSEDISVTRWWSSEVKELLTEIWKHGYEQGRLEQECYEVCK